MKGKVKERLLLISLRITFLNPYSPPFSNGKGRRGIKNLFKHKTLIKEKRVIKVSPANQFDGMVASLTHAPNR